MNQTKDANSQAMKVRANMKRGFARKGLVIAIASGVTYGIYSAFMTLGMSRGVWTEWYGAGTHEGVLLSAFMLTFIVAAIGAGVNDLLSGGYTLIRAGASGRLPDFARTMKTKPGMIMMLSAFIGGPISATAYVVALQMAGSIVVPISALCPVIGAFLGKLLFKQPLTARMLAGVVICFSGALMIASTGMSADAPENLMLGIAIAFIAAVGWGFEGCVCGYGTSLIDYNIAITIRQVTSGIGNLFIIVPILTLVGGESLGMSTELIFAALTSVEALPFFILGGIFGAMNYGFWYKGAGMCGAALGMACNGMFSFWSPLFLWLIVGVIGGQPGWEMAPIAWAAAVVISFGILVISMNPMDLFRKKEEA